MHSGLISPPQGLAISGDGKQAIRTNYYRNLCKKYEKDEKDEKDEKLLIVISLQKDNF